MYIFVYIYFNPNFQRHLNIMESNQAEEKLAQTKKLGKGESYAISKKAKLDQAKQDLDAGIYKTVQCS